MVDGQPIAGIAVRFRPVLLSQRRGSCWRAGAGPYFYLPKMESHLEARLWNDVFVFAQDCAGRAARHDPRHGADRDAFSAAFEMDEILYELRDHSAGLNCGRWDYIFSFIKKLADRAGVRAAGPRAGDDGQRRSCASYVAAADPDLPPARHPRDGRHGGADSDQGRSGSERRRRWTRCAPDKLREVKAGHDGTWVAHPGLVPIAKEVFDEHMPTPNQIAAAARGRHGRRAADLLEPPTGRDHRRGPAAEHRRRHAVSGSVAAAGNGCVPIYNLMEDAATAEISRTQVWQWMRHGAELDDGRTVTANWCDRWSAATHRVRRSGGGGSRRQTRRGARALSKRWRRLRNSLISSRCPHTRFW